MQNRIFRFSLPLSLRVLPKVLLAMVLFSCSQTEEKWTVSSPGENINVVFSINDNGEARYSVTRDDITVISESLLGIRMAARDFSGGLELVDTSSPELVDFDYQLLNGKRSHCKYNGYERKFRLINGDGDEMDIIFRVSDDGVAFRYFFPGEPGEGVQRIEEELTSYIFPEGSRAWIQPMALAQTGFANTNPSYEEFYMQDIAIGTASLFESGWVYPALFSTPVGNWVLISEAGLGRNYCGTRLRTLEDENGYTVGFPQSPEVFPGGALFPESGLPWETPWRIIVVGDLGTIVESTLGTDMADPAVLMDTSFIKPGRSAWSWALLKDQSVVYDVQKRFIDYAADMGWEYSLVDVNWDRNIGYERIAELAEYAISKDVGLLLWYNSSGDWNETVYSPKSRLLTRKDRREEFRRISDMGVKGIKVDFFAGDGQSMIEYYQDIFEDAADFELLVNCHGSTIPRGWQRTYPNLMTMESVRGFEFMTFFQEDADQTANHAAMLPFTRNVFGPMDYTPVCLYEIPGIERQTTNGFELATAVLFQSGIQHFAETPEGMATAAEFARNFLGNVPVTWDDIVFLGGFPGEYVVLARRKGDSWYIAGINGTNENMDVDFDLSVLGNDITGYKITDGASARELLKEDLILNGGEYSVSMKPKGGFVMVCN